MTQNPRFGDLQALESVIHQMEWSKVSLEPDPIVVKALDQQMPGKWLQSLEAPDLEVEFDQEVLGPLFRMSDEELNIQVQSVISELEVDVKTIMKELDMPDLGHDHSLDLDVGR